VDVTGNFDYKTPETEVVFTNKEKQKRRYFTVRKTPHVQTESEALTYFLNHCQKNNIKPLIHEVKHAFSIVWSEQK